MGFFKKIKESEIDIIESIQEFIREKESIFTENKKMNGIAVNVIFNTSLRVYFLKFGVHYVSKLNQTMANFESYAVFQTAVTKFENLFASGENVFPKDLQVLKNIGDYLETPNYYDKDDNGDNVKGRLLAITTASQLNGHRLSAFHPQYDKMGQNSLDIKVVDGEADLRDFTKNRGNFIENNSYNIIDCPIGEADSYEVFKSLVSGLEQLLVKIDEKQAGKDQLLKTFIGKNRGTEREMQNNY